MTTEVVTVTVNPAVDQTVWIPGFRAGEVNRVRRQEVTPGGKGVNVAAFLTSFGVPTLATGFLGAQNAGLFKEFFRERGILDRFVPIAGTTRTGVKIVDNEAGATTDINFPGFDVAADQVAKLETTVASLAPSHGWIVLSGSLPPGAPVDLYARLATAARAAGARVAVDTSGRPLAEALHSPPDLVKPNRAELEELTGRTLGGRDALAGAAHDLVKAGIATVVVSLGGEGALFVRAGEAVFAAAPAVPVASTVGAGDAMVAGTITATLRGLPLADVAALATAAAATKIGRVGPYLDAVAVEAGAKTVAVHLL
ncbi:MAG: 1-phosphofructokinase [Actinomycetota bacterium]|nr:1-phosphofructokinase [Actinomycetota bacterium]